ncbi:MAG: DUF1294 domain-containing protein [Candidatus Pacebacteria bacterium]|nr:DUF1294 domain-containing protein [Candidatus Paceibacterota bacterium]MBP9842995.1 DUF1294 domain-containing protein [Candidatus Paceibacterota bacterium]
MYLEQILVSIFVFVNIVAFFIMANDKHKSMRGSNTERTPEGLIFFLAGVLGALGVYVGMLVFRHKTRKWYFQLGIPLLIFQNFATAYLLYNLTFL